MRRALPIIVTMSVFACASNAVERGNVEPPAAADAGPTRAQATDVHRVDGAVVERVDAGDGNAGDAGGVGSVSGKVGLQVNGSIAFPRGPAVSAPIFPKVLVLYEKEAEAFPTTLAAEEQLVRDAALTFEALLETCKPLYPEIILPPDGGALLSGAALAKNFDLVAQCSYEQYTVKPYWIPQLVDDVDICGQEMGPGWKLLGEDDLDHFLPADYAYFAQVLASLPTQAMGSLYFSLDVYLRGKDGTLKQGDLSPNATDRVKPLPMGVDGTPKTHLESVAIALRCIQGSVLD